jgi:hypothetical protein
VQVPKLFEAMLQLYCENEQAGFQMFVSKRMIAIAWLD